MFQSAVRSSVPAALLLLGTTLAASAADLGGRPAKPFPVDPGPGTWAPLAVEQWTGFYIGATYGYADGKIRVDDAFDIDQSGGIGTLFAGYNLQLGRAVIGVEADVWGLGNVSGNDSSDFYTAELDRLYSVRGRLGFLATPALLVYATGGAAWANYDIGFIDTKSQKFDGWQVGGGAELMLSPNWTVKLEYLYTDLNAETVPHTGSDFDPDFHTVRAGFSLKF